MIYSDQDRECQPALSNCTYSLLDIFSKLLHEEMPMFRNQIAMSRFRTDGLLLGGLFIRARHRQTRVINNV
jgi:hypothetical protein